MIVILVNLTGFCRKKPSVEDIYPIRRIATLPGQLTAYDSGGLEILALRQLAEDAMGKDFDIRELH